MVRRFLLLLCFTPIFLMAGLFSGFRLTGNKCTVAFTGDLGDVFHPTGNQSGVSSKISRLNDIINELKKSYPEVIFVDTGHFLNLPDTTETDYNNIPVMTFLQTSNFELANLGARDLLMTNSLRLFDIHRDKKPTLLSIFKYCESGKNIGDTFKDVSIGEAGAIRFLGAAIFNTERFAPSLMKRYKSPALPDMLPALLEQSPRPTISIFLSCLSPAENDRLAEKVTSLSLIIEKDASPKQPVRKVHNTYIVHRDEMETVGLVTFKIKSTGVIGNISVKNYHLNPPQADIFSFLNRKKSETSTSPLPRIGEILPSEELLGKVGIQHDSYEIRRIIASGYSSRVNSTNIYYYDLFKYYKRVGKSFYVDHVLDKGYPQLLFIATLDNDNRLASVDFVFPITLPEGIAETDGFLKSYIGKRHNEIQFEPGGCSGMETVFKTLHNDLWLLLEIAAKFTDQD